MKRTVLTIMSFVFVFGLVKMNAQDDFESPEMISTAIYHDVVGPLKDFPAMTPEEHAEMDLREARMKRNQELKVRNYPYWEETRPAKPDAGLQTEMGTRKSLNGILQNWEGQYSYSYPPDCNGTAGPNHYMQTINVKYTIYDKVGTLLAGPTNLNTLFSGVPGANNNDGDPVILFDEQAQRWMVAEFSGVYSNPDYMLIAVSQTDDPTGLWDRWSFVMNGFPDYMKFGVWRDGYYMGTNTYSGNDIYVFERDVMIAGGASPQMVQFNNPYRPNSGFHCVLPLDNDAAFSPVGTPGGFITINDNAWGGSTQDQLWIYELDVNWAVPSSSTFARVQQLDVEAFDSYFGPNWDNIAQPGTAQKLDAINQILMHRAQYRNFSGSQHIVCNHTIDVDNTDHGGIRWYELEHDGTEWTIRQFGTYAPDGDSRWMGSMAMNAAHEIAIGYSVSSSSTYPSIRYAGQSASENANASGILDIAEVSIIEGTASQTGYNRWGDYSNLAVDPVDDHTFWFTTEYNLNGSMKGTRVASFEFATVPLVDFVADNLTPGTTDTVAFTDLSTGSPIFWSWTFTPSTITYLNGTSFSSQNPDVRFDAQGFYTVELIATNSIGPGTETKIDYINAGEGMAVIATADPDEICAGDWSQLNAAPTGGSGTYTYSWTSDPAGFASTIQDPVAMPVVNTLYMVEVFDGSLTANGEVTVTVNPLPVITLGDWPEMLCNVGVPPVQLTALPEGGIYSGTGVSATGLFITSIAELGWNVITYTYEDANGCVNAAQDSIYVDDCVGIAEMPVDESAVNIYPNPSMGSFTLESEYMIDKIEIIDQNGKMVMMRKINGTSTAISALRSKGLYFVRVYSIGQDAKTTVVNKEIIIR
ncbi:MAG: T9SS type A sorting domain-containing protein [Bacteroidetes bacterium]|nr:T9SS type A sorting domain-containing protein [Bacteroidota bacterium]